MFISNRKKRKLTQDRNIYFSLVCLLFMNLVIHKFQNNSIKKRLNLKNPLLSRAFLVCPRTNTCHLSVHAGVLELVVCTLD